MMPNAASAVCHFRAELEYMPGLFGKTAVYYREDPAILSKEGAHRLRHGRTIMTMTFCREQLTDHGRSGDSQQHSAMSRHMAGMRGACTIEQFNRWAPACAAATQHSWGPVNMEGDARTRQTGSFVRGKAQ